MASFVFNQAKGRVRTFAELPGATDSLILVPLEYAGLPADSVLVDLDDLAAVLAAATEHPMGRQTLTGVTSQVDDAGDFYYADADDVVWTGVTGNEIGCLVLAYKPSSSANDSTCTPIAKYEFKTTPNGQDITAQVNVAGLFRSE